jgi:hypothetical protein
MVGSLSQDGTLLWEVTVGVYGKEPVSTAGKVFVPSA